MTTQVASVSVQGVRELKNLASTAVAHGSCRRGCSRGCFRGCRRSCRRGCGRGCCR